MGQRQEESRKKRTLRGEKTKRKGHKILKEEKYEKGTVVVDKMNDDWRVDGGVLEESK